MKARSLAAAALLLACTSTTCADELQAAPDVDYIAPIFELHAGTDPRAALPLVRHNAQLACSTAGLHGSICAAISSKLRACADEHTTRRAHACIQAAGRTLADALHIYELRERRD